MGAGSAAVRRARRVSSVPGMQRALGLAARCLTPPVARRRPARSLWHPLVARTRRLPARAPAGTAAFACEPCALGSACHWRRTPGTPRACRTLQGRVQRGQPGLKESFKVVPRAPDGPVDSAVASPCAALGQVPVAPAAGTRARGGALPSAAIDEPVLGAPPAPQAIIARHGGPMPVHLAAPGVARVRERARARARLALMRASVSVRSSACHAAATPCAGCAAHVLSPSLPGVLLLVLPPPSPRHSLPRPLHCVWGVGLCSRARVREQRRHVERVQHRQQHLTRQPVPHLCDCDVNPAPALHPAPPRKQDKQHRGRV